MDYTERARLAANTLHSAHSQEEAKAHTTPARTAFLAQFKTDAEKRTYYSELAAKSAAVRRTRSGRAAVDDRVLTILRLAYPKAVPFSDLLRVVHTGRARLTQTLNGLVESEEVVRVGAAGREFRAVPPTSAG